jgi:hypothetical protein
LEGYRCPCRGIFDFSNKPFVGSLATNPPTSPIIAVAAFAS